MDQNIIEARLKEVRATADKAYKALNAGSITATDFDKIMGRAERDAEALTKASRTRTKAYSYAANSDSREHNRATGALDAGAYQGKTVKRNLSPLDLPQAEIHNLFEAAKHKQPYSCEIKSFGDNITYKTTGSPVSEGAPYPTGLLPPVIQPGLTQELRYEPYLADALPTLEIEAPSIEYLVHTGNTNPAATVSELGVKADLGQQWTPQIAIPIKMAALSSASMEILRDFPEFNMWLPRELARAVQDITTAQIVTGSGTGGNMTGILNTAGVLTRVYNGAHDISGIDTVLQAVNDIRVGSAKAHADLIVMHPTGWDNLRRTKTTTDAFVLQEMNPGAIGSLNDLWGIEVITNTYVPDGTAIVMDRQLAARWFVRQGLTVDTNPWGDTEWTTNSVSFRAELRAVLGVLRPTAISVVTGLFPYSGS